jgi:hypothetical protein
MRKSYATHQSQPILKKAWEAIANGWKKAR